MEMASLIGGNALLRIGAMGRKHKGFTLIEIVMGLVIGAILVSFAIQAFGATANNSAARQARNLFNSMAARARAQAIESGRNTVLIADARGDSVVILANGGVVETVRFGGEMDVDIQAAQDVTILCMNPRGYADQNCNSFNTTVSMSFVQGNQSRSLEILPLGQIRW